MLENLKLDERYDGFLFLAESALNPLIGKSVALYFHKPEVRGASN